MNIVATKQDGSRREDFFHIEETETITPSVQTDAATIYQENKSILMPDPRYLARSSSPIGPTVKQTGSRNRQAGNRVEILTIIAAS